MGHCTVTFVMYVFFMGSADDGAVHLSPPFRSQVECEDAIGNLVQFWTPDKPTFLATCFPSSHVAETLRDPAVRVVFDRGL